MGKMKFVDIGVSDQQIKDWIEPLISQREKLQSEIKELREKEAQITAHIIQIVRLYSDFWRESPVAKRLISEHPFLHFLVEFSSIPSIGDAAFKILEERGPLAKKELVQELLESGIGISEKNASTVLGTAIKRDTQKRFIVRKGGKITLAVKKGK
jgi:hypothetical protein